jgi:hypothetical protein
MNDMNDIKIVREELCEKNRKVQKDMQCISRKMSKTWTKTHATNKRGQYKRWEDD